MNNNCYQLEGGGKRSLASRYRIVSGYIADIMCYLGINSLKGLHSPL